MNGAIRATAQLVNPVWKARAVGYSSTHQVRVDNM